MALVWLATVTRTSTVPLPAGLVALQLVVVEQDTAVAAVAPNATVVAPGVVLNPVPLIATLVLPAAGPELGAIELTVGAGARYVNWSATLVALVWPPTVTLTSTVPAAWAGLVAVQLVVVEQDTAVAAPAPKATVVAPGVVLNPVPVIVTAVPPAVGPLVGAMLLTAGAATYVN